MKYDVDIHPDTGQLAKYRWTVSISRDGWHDKNVATGTASLRENAEIDARCAIIDYEASRAKADVRSTGRTQFRVKT